MNCSRYRRSIDINVLKYMPEIVSFKSNCLDWTSWASWIGRLSPNSNQVKTLQLEENRIYKTALISRFLRVKFPNLENLMLDKNYRMTNDDLVPSLFMVPPKLQTLKINASLLCRICSSNLSKLKNLCIFYDASCDEKVIISLLSSADVSSLRILKIEEDFDGKSFQYLWKLAIGILGKTMQLKVLIVRGKYCQQKALPWLENQKKLLFEQRKVQKFRPELLYFNFFEIVFKNELDQATISRLGELDAKFQWGLQ